MVTNRQRVYVSLKQDIMNGTLRSGEMIADRPLAEKYQVSRTPVREAIQQLKAEGFLEVEPNIGTRVAMVQEDRIPATYELLGRIEQGGVELLSNAVLPKLIMPLTQLNDAYRDAIEKSLWQEAMNIDREFHQVMLRRSPSNYASKFADILRVQLRPTESRYYQRQFPKKIEAVEDHAALIALLTNGKQAEAGRLARRHRMKQAKMLRKML